MGNSPRKFTGSFHLLRISGKQSEGTSKKSFVFSAKLNAVSKNVRRDSPALKELSILNIYVCHNSIANSSS